MKILEAPFIKEFGRTATMMHRNGWQERNSGNISYMIDEEEIKYFDDLSVKKTLPLEFPVPNLNGKYYLITGSGKYLKNIEINPEENIGLIQIVDEGTKYNVIWGFGGINKPTSELSTHLLSHEARLKVDEKHKVVIHSHATNIMAMTFVHELDDRAFTRSLWKSITEAIVVFPEGVGVLPWMLCGNHIIGQATASKMLNKKIVVWAMHGVFASGESLDDCFGLIETVEKSAQIYLKIKGMKQSNNISDMQLKELAESFKVNYRKDYLDNEVTNY